MRTAVLALLGLACLFMGWLLGFILPGARIFAWAILALGAVLVAVAVAIDRRRVGGALASRRGRLGVGATVRVSLFAGIMVLANAISMASYHRFDLTGLAQFTLTSQTKDVLARLDKPVEIVGVFKPGVTSALGAYSQNLLAEYRIHSDRLSVRTIDPDLSPDQARHYGVDQFGALLGAVVFTGEAGRKLVFGPQIAGAAEHAFTAAILEVTGVKQKKVYFLTGHGEHGITADYDSARRGLRDNLYQVAELDLLTGAGIPEDAAVVVLAGPRRPLVAGELRVLKDHLAADGRLLVLLDPGAPESLRRLLSEWWLDIEPGRIVDPSSHVAPKVDSPLVDRTGNSFGLAQVYFPGATALLPRDEVPDGVELSALAWSSPDSWLETSFASGAAPRRDEQTDRKGPLAIGALVSTTPAGTPDTSKGARLAVIGDSDFAANPHFHNGNNGELFLATVNWLAAGTQIIAVDRKALAVRRLLLSPAQARFLHVSAIGLLPLLLLLAAGALWWPGSRS